MNAVCFTGVSLALGGRTILAGLDLAIGQGKFIGMLGPNGAGKTTLFRAILGLVPAASGHIEVLAQAVTRGNKAVGYMPQTRAALGGMRLSGFDFVASAAAGGKWGLPLLGKAGRRDVADAIDLVEAGDLARRPIGSLSGGERQKLLLAQALLGRPKLLLLDEPLISLDPHHQEAVVALVRSLQLRLGITVLFSAHELNPLLGVMDQVLYLGGGQAALGSVDQVITGPVLSRLYGSQIDVFRVGGRIFVMSGGMDIERDRHVHV